MIVKVFSLILVCVHFQPNEIRFGLRFQQPMSSANFHQSVLEAQNVVEALRLTTNL